MRDALAQGSTLIGMEYPQGHPQTPSRQAQCVQMHSQGLIGRSENCARISDSECEGVMDERELALGGYFPMALYKVDSCAPLSPPSPPVPSPLPPALTDDDFIYFRPQQRRLNRHADLGVPDPHSRGKGRGEPAEGGGLH